MLVEEEDAEGVLKMNSKILDTGELKKLDKLEKYTVQDLHNTEKGRTGSGCLMSHTSNRLIRNCREFIATLLLPTVL